MLILLPPSETKRPGGGAGPLELERLRLPALLPEREAVTAALVALGADPVAAQRALKLGPTQLGEIPVIAGLRSAPTTPAIDRYTGVLYDALCASTLDAAARRWLGRHLLIHSAPFGPVGALDRIPNYRLGAAARVPGLPPLVRLWAERVSEALRAEAPSFVLDLRSEAYVALGPIPASVPSAYVRVVSESATGATRALNHFNKHAKGELVRRLALDRPRVRSRAGLLAWADAAGVALREESPGGELLLVV
jgi:hypothetical protein